MRLQSKLFLGIGVVLSVSLAGVMYTDTVNLRNEFEADMRANAHDIQALLMATRHVYQKQFLESGLPINDETIGFLPAHAFSRISTDFSELTEKGIYFNNVSDRPRNPANLADAVELEAIRYFRDNPKAQDRMVAFTGQNGEPAYHFAAPLWMEAFCLACHGPRESAPPGIQAGYDMGYEYKIGDLRGILSIKLPASRLIEQIDQRRGDALIQYAGMFIVMFLLLGVAVNRLVVRRLVSLQKASEALQRGETTALKNMSCSDEIGRLSCNFNRMAEVVMNREQALRDRESLQRAVVESAKDAIVMADDSGVILLFNPVACRLFGYDQKEIVGQPLTQLIPESMRAAHSAGFDHHRRTGESVLIGSSAIHVDARHKDGSEFPIEMSLGEGRGSSRRIFVATIRDIRARLKSQADLQLAATAFESQGPMMITDASGEIIRVNPAFCDATGYTADEVLGHNPRMLQSGRQDTAFYKQMWDTLLATGSWQGELWNRRKNGAVFPEWLSISAVRDQRGEAIHYVGAFTDLSRLVEQREIIERMVGEERALGQLLRHAVTPALMQEFLEASLETLFTSVPWLRMEPSGGVFLLDESMPQTLRLVADRFNEPAVREYCASIAFGQCLCGKAAAECMPISTDSSDEQHEFQYPGIKPHGHYILPIHLSDCLLGVMVLYLPPEQQRSEVELCFLERVADVLGMGIQRRHSDAEIEHQAYHDALTGLPNRRLLKDLLQQELSVANRRNLSGALLFIDLDNFKHLNDSLGHSLGDLILIDVSRRLREQLREGDTVARLGGDEFVVLLPALGSEEDTVSRQALLVADKLRVCIAEPCSIDGRSHHLTASIGITLLPGDIATVDDLLKRADTAMYQSKQQGRDRVCFYQPHLQETIDARLFLETELRQAIARNELQLYYQPQVDSGGYIVGAEALLRWQHQQRGAISPAEFIPVAEESALILELGDWVLNMACAQMSQWRATGLDARLKHLAINVSPQQFQESNFVERMIEIVGKHGVEPGALVLELTEGIMVQNVEQVIGRMIALKKLGFGIAIDDFGTGYSSLTYLKNLPLDLLKIDRSFVCDVDKDPRDAAVVETIISMAEYMDLEVIAEGVETTSELLFLRTRGCGKFQGYYFSEPLCVQEFTLLLEDSEHRYDA